MAIFQDLAGAVQNYLNTKVVCQVCSLGPDVPPLCNKNEGFDYKLLAKNNGTAADGVNLINVRFFIRSTSPTLKFIAPPAIIATARTGYDNSSPIINPGTAVSQMYLFPNSNTGCNILPVNSTRILMNLKGNFGTTLGVIYFKLKVFAEPELIYPKNEDCPESQIFRTIQP